MERLQGWELLRLLASALDTVKKRRAIKAKVLS